MIAHRLIQSLLVATTVAACGARMPRDERVPVRGLVQLADAEVRSLALLMRMEDTRALDTMLVTSLMQTASPEVRSRAVTAAGRIRDPAAVPLLIRALSDPDMLVRRDAAFALGEIADSSSQGTLAALGTVALHGTGVAAAEATSALGRMGIPAARPVIDSLLTTPRAPSLLHEALLAAWRLPRAASTLDAVARHTDADDPETRWRAAYALARTLGPAAVPHLLPLARDPDHVVRAQAMRGLRAPLADSAGVRDDALAAALRGLADPHPHVRINAINLLPGYREPARTVPPLVAALRDTDPNVVIAAIQALGTAAGATSAAAPAVDATLVQSAAAALSGITASEALPDGVRTAALSTLVRLDSGPGSGVAAAWADSARWVLRLHAARALGAAPWSAAAAPLEKLARDAHYLVAADALNAMRAATDSTTPGVRRLFIEGLTARHPLVRAAAVAGLARGATAADLDLFLVAYDRSRTDSVADASLAAISALGRLRRAGVPAERSFYLRFGQFGPPSDAAVFRAIQTQLQEIPPQWGTAPEPRIEPRDIGFYEDVIRRLVAPVLAGGPPPQAVISTPHGEIVVQLASAEAPLTVHNFLSLIERGYYVNTRWHRVVPNFVIQDGDPRGDGSGGPGYRIRDEINPLRYDRGALGMALSGPDTGGSQWFITHSPQPHLDGGYTVFGRVIQGMDVVDRVVQEEPILGMRSGR